MDSIDKYQRLYRVKLSFKTGVVVEIVKVLDNKQNSNQWHDLVSNEDLEVRKCSDEFLIPAEDLEKYIAKLCATPKVIHL